ncbi:MAG: YhbY family RNA-binding protein [Clostridia bacterium]|nr:YhbY family RNA-binding protein [Clostridia bacterium]
MISAKDRSELRSKANTLTPLVFVGKEGVDEGVIDEVKLCLYNNELIKVGLQKSCSESAKETGERIAQAAECELIQCLGRKITLYKRTDKKGFEHLLK